MEESLDVSLDAVSFKEGCSLSSSRDSLSDGISLKDPFWRALVSSSSRLGGCSRVVIVTWNKHVSGRQVTA